MTRAVESFEDAVRRLVASRVEQGLESQESDPSTLARIAEVCRAHDADQLRGAA